MNCIIQRKNELIMHNEENVFVGARVICPEGYYSYSRNNTALLDKHKAET